MASHELAVSSEMGLLAPMHHAPARALVAARRRYKLRDRRPMSSFRAMLPTLTLLRCRECGYCQRSCTTSREMYGWP